MEKHKHEDGESRIILLRKEDGLAYVGVDAKTRFLWKNREITWDFLREGDSLILYFNESVRGLETYPMQYSEKVLQIEYVE